MIEIEPGSVQQPGGGGDEPRQQPRQRSWWLRPAMHTALIGAVLGYVLGHWLGNYFASGYQQIASADSSDFPIVLGYGFAVIGWLAGLGVFNDLILQMLGKPVATNTNHLGGGLGKYFRYSLDHKVVGIQ